ncbi:ABC-type molybdate transport system substrate-binding protein [Pseudarthrobacter defluvii]|uniref:hypothetical protein n=1 Tax=Pseudarthrobacter defluvii TaxID=410837 RepID=UPI00277FE16E|nr:hypothetical protein [Pseudarthrobacter defluvii]MDQ0768202.1 ABC-type molybdate transport system substrate-binding protein [Pseudarthrobacter defluvii]
MGNTGGSLFGTRMVWARIIAISVIFAAWMQISSCNASKEGASQEAAMSAAATSTSAISYCEESVRKQNSIHQQLHIISSTSTKMATRGYRVITKYEYFSGATKQMTSDSETCNVEWTGSRWRPGMLF